GKDSFRHFHAGSAVAGIASTGKFGMVKRLDAPRGVLDLASMYFADVDIVLTEGFKRDAAPKIEVSRKALGTGLLCERRSDRLVAIVADHAPRGVGRLPVFAFDDICGLADFLEKRFMKKRCPASGGFSVRLVADKKRVPMKPFVQEFIAGSIYGMTGALRGVKSPKSITVTIERKGR
ncbi:MAG: molybdopterin-guanine dinucleotide biosynthesis protein MobB, partial [Planctomycetota bacterium]|nr:molybdopterin-guanine dinucleotide biosynthesis protein MobB [Planctomycetota bacterium]